jgi:predicted small lipoprotein YifL
MKIWGDRFARTSLLVLFVASSLAAFGQSGSVNPPPTDQNAPVSQSKPAPTGHATRRELSVLDSKFVFSIVTGPAAL